MQEESRFVQKFYRYPGLGTGAAMRDRKVFVIVKKQLVTERVLLTGQTGQCIDLNLFPFFMASPILSTITGARQ